MAQSYETDILLKIDIAQAKKDLQAINDQIKTLNATTDNTEDQVKALERQWDLLSTTIEKAEKIQKPLNSQLEEITKQLQKMKYAGQENTAEYQNLVKEAGKLKDAIGDTEATIKNAASDTANLDAVLSGMGAVSGGFGIVTTAMSMFGAESEKTEKYQKRLMQAIALVNSVQTISKALNKDSALMQKINAAASGTLAKQMNATAVATNAASSAMGKLKSALISTGLGAFAVVLGYVVNLILDYVSATDSATTSNEELKESIDKLNTAKEKYDDLVFQGLNNEQKLAKLNEKKAELEAKYFEALNKSSDALNEYGENSKEYIDSQTALIDIQTEQIRVDNEIKKIEDDIAKGRDAAAKKAKADAEAEANERKRLLNLAQQQLDMINKIKEANTSSMDELEIQLMKLQAESVKDDPTEYKLRMLEIYMRESSNAVVAENKLYKSEQDNIKAAFKALKETREKLGQDTSDLDGKQKKALEDAENAHNLRVLINTQDFLNKKKELFKAEAEEEQNITDDANQKREADLYDMLDAANQIGSIIESIGEIQDDGSKKGFENQKKTQIASALITGAAGAAGAYAQAAGTIAPPAGPIIGAVNAAAVIASTAARIASIKKQKYNAPNESAASSTDTGASSASAAEIGTGTSSVSRAIISRNISSAVSEGTKIQTVLVVDDVTSKQMQAQNINKVSTI